MSADVDRAYVNIPMYSQKLSSANLFTVLAVVSFEACFKEFM